MDFMVLPVRLHSKSNSKNYQFVSSRFNREGIKGEEMKNSIFRIALVLWLFISLQFSCSNKNIEIPAIFILQSDPSFTIKNGKLFYKNHFFSGWQYNLYASGDTAKIISFYKGKKQGLEKAWWENNRVKFIYHFSNDVYEGNVKEWYESGQLYRDFNYHNGHEYGQQKAYKSDGRLKVNYIIKEGRKYGLTGVKNCVTVGDADSI